MWWRFISFGLDTYILWGLGQIFVQAQFGNFYTVRKVCGYCGIILCKTVWSCVGFVVGSLRHRLT